MFLEVFDILHRDTVFMRNMFHVRLGLCDQSDEVWLFVLSDKTLQCLRAVFYQVPKRQTGPAELSQDPCGTDRDLLNYIQMEGWLSTICVIMLVSWVPLSTM